MSGSASTSTPTPERAGGASGADGYDALVERSPQGSLFASSWWLDAVAPGRWRPHLVDGAAWPTVVRRTGFGDVHTGAPLTPYLGPLLTPGESAHQRRSREIEQLEALLHALAGAAHVEAACSPAFDYWTPLHWHGFGQTTHYTWRLPDVRDSEGVFSGLRENVRREVRKARKRGVRVDEGTLDEYLGVHARTAERHGRGAAAQASTEALRRADAAAARRGARSILVARDGEGRVHAGGYFLHDAEWTYYLLGGSDDELRTSGAHSLVLWTAIERAGERGTGFDFEGSMLRPVERFVRAFGGEPVPYSHLRWTPSRAYAALRAAKRGAVALRSLR